jgi:hypothetical protein
MLNQHPITPPPELLDEWCMDPTLSNWRDIATKAAQWGADQELEACCEWIPELTPWDAEQLRAARRPKPPSLKEQALHELNDVYNRDKIDDSTYDTICRALEALDD